MDYIQSILVYLTLALAIGYLVRKFLWPKRLFSSKKNSSKSCGEENCGCH